MPVRPSMPTMVSERGARRNSQRPSRDHISCSAWVLPTSTRGLPPFAGGAEFGEQFQLRIAAALLEHGVALGRRPAEERLGQRLGHPALSADEPGIVDQVSRRGLGEEVAGKPLGRGAGVEFGN